MAIICSAYHKEGILKSADILPAWMIEVPRGAEMFIDGRLVVNIIFCNQIASVNL